MAQDQLGVLMSAALDVVNAKSKINAQIKQLQVEALKVGVKLDTASAKQAIKQLQTQQDSFYKRNLSGIDAEIAKRRQASEIFSQQIKSQMQQAILAENAVAAARKKSVVDDTFATKIKSSQQDLLRLKDTFSSIGNNANLSAQWQGLFDSSKLVKSKEELQNLNAKIGLFRKEIGASNALLDQAAIKALKAIAIMKAFQLSVVAIRSMSSEVVALDTSLTELQKVVDLSGAQLDNFTDRAFKAAEQVGRTGREMIDATTQFKKAGYDLDNSLNLAKATLIMNNIGDGIRDVGEASSSLIAVLKGFDIDDSKVMSVLDSINEVANNSPIAFENIAEGLRRVSGTLSQTGTDINETIGLLTGGFSQIRNVEKVSTALITISQRLRGVGEDGESIDGLSASLQKEFGAVGIAIEDANGELRSTYDILADYANIYDTLSSKQQQFLSELASGKRQVPVINAIVQQWDDVQNAIDQSTNSLGSAERENAIFMESIQGKLNLLKSTFQEFATDTIDSNLVKSIVDLGTASLETVDSLGGLQNILVLITGLLVAKNWNTITSAFTGIVGKVKDIPTAFRTAKQESAGLSGALNLLGISASTAQLAIGTLTAVVTIGIAAYNAYKQAEEEARQTALAAADEANQQTIAITELTGKYLKLAEAVDLDGDSKKELLSLQQQLLKNFDLEGESIDDLTKKYGGLTEAIKGKTLEVLQAEQINLIGGLGAAEKNLIDSNSSGFFTGNNILNAVGDDAIEAFKALEKAGIINSGSYGSSGGALVLTGDESTVEGAFENYNRLGEALEVLRDKMGHTELQNNSLFTAMSKRYQELEPSIKGYNDLISQLNNNLSNQVVIESLRGQELPKTKAEFDALAESAVKTAQANGQFVGSAADIENSVMGVLSTMPQFQSFFTDVVTQTSDLSQTTEQLIEALSKEREETNQLVSSANMLSAAFAEQNKNGSLSIDTMFKVVDAGYAAALSFDTQTGACYLNKDALLELIKVKIQNQIRDLEIIKNDLENKLINDGIAAAQSANGFLILANAKAAASSDDYKGYQDATAQIKALENVLNNAGNVAAGTFSSGMKSAASSAQSAANDIKQAMSSAQSAIQSLLQMTMNMLKQQYNNQKKNIQSQIDDLSREQQADEKAVNDKINRRKKQYESDKKALSALEKQQKRLYDSEKKMLEALAKAKDKEYDKALKALDDELSAYEKIINKQKELLNEKEAERDYQTELSEKQKGVSTLESKIADISRNTSAAGIKKRLELEEELSDKRKELEEFQHDRSVELQLGALDAEYKRFEEIQNGKIEAIELEKEKYKELYDQQLADLETRYQIEQEIHDQKAEQLEADYERDVLYHEQELERIQSEFDARRTSLEQELKKVEEVSLKESNIRAEAIKLIEDKNSDLYNKLLQWNKEYGDGLDSTVINGWNNAQDALNQFNADQKGVLGTLNSLAIEMNNFESSTQNAATAMRDLASAIESKNSAERNYSSSKRPLEKDSLYNFNNKNQKKKYHSGTSKVLKNSSGLYQPNKIKSDEVETVLQVGEAVVPVKQPRRAVEIMADFINSNLDVKEFLKSSDTASDSKFIQSVVNPIGNIGKYDMSKYQLIENDSRSMQINLGDVQILGNADNAVMDNWLKNRESKLKDVFATEVFNRMNKINRTRGTGINAKHKYI